VSYYPHNQKEPSGCIQTIVITRAIIGIVMVPTLIVIGAIIGLLLAFYALTISPFLGLAVVLTGVGIIYLAARWESKRVSRDFPADEP
jgi:hypothetical protein